MWRVKSVKVINFSSEALPAHWDRSQLTRQRQLQHLQRVVNESNLWCVFDAAKPKNSEDGPANSAHKASLSAARCDPKHKDCLLREFRKLCAMVAEKPSYNVKTQIIQDFLRKGSAGGMAPACSSQLSSESASRSDLTRKGEIKIWSLGGPSLMLWLPSEFRNHLWEVNSLNSKFRQKCLTQAL